MGPGGAAALVRGDAVRHVHRGPGGGEHEEQALPVRFGLFPRQPGQPGDAQQKNDPEDGGNHGGGRGGTVHGEGSPNPPCAGRQFVASEAFSQTVGG